MNKSTSVIVIGGGIIGATIAANLASQGVQVSLIEKETVGGNGATKFSGALFRLYDPDKEISQLTRNSIELMENSITGKVFAKSLNRCGILYASDKTPSDHESISGCINKYSDDLYPMELVSQDFANSITHGYYSKNNARTLLYESKGGCGNIRKTAKDMCVLVKEYGNLVLENTHVDEINSTSNGVTVRCGSHVFQADYLVIATGAWSKKFAKNLPIDTKTIPLASLKATVELPFPIIDTKTGTHIIPLNFGYYLAGSKIRTSALEPEFLNYDDELIIRDILERLGGSHLSHSPTDIVAVLKGFDSYTTDGRPVIDFVDDHQRAMVAAGFCGVGYKIALAVAEQVKYALLSREIGGELPEAQATGLFSISRFSSKRGT
ncbi:FAD-binding oxidoreductase [Serratia rubidaea]|nr:FAD-binding oxidoreductase [Serratia rubidaea]